MSANEKDLEIEDDLAKGTIPLCVELTTYETNVFPSPEDTSRPQIKDLITIEEEFCVGEGCEIPRFSNSFADPKSDGVGRGISAPTLPRIPQLTVSSKTKLQVISRMLRIYKKVSFQMTRRLKNTGTCYFFSNPSLDI